ncbi:MAG: hypothetical protein M0Z85_09775 [Gammaproteobacteria bacterium]|nr:hypothetical protein [Gammaproteobacteria bacterium]
MPSYVEDPENPGNKIDAIELLKRSPDVPPPPEATVGLMRRDKWTRHEALLILAGFSSSNNVLTGTPVGLIGAGIAYLDGTTDGMIQQAGLSQPHPLHFRMFSDYMTLRWYASGEDIDERRTPVEWLAWAESKGFTPYWLEYWNDWLNKQRVPVEYGRIESAEDVIKHVERREKGRYTLREAAEAFAENTGEQLRVMRDKLMAAVESGALRVYAPGSEISYRSETVRDFYEEAYWNDLNAWLADAEPRSSWRFPEPTIAMLARKQREQEAEHVAAGGFRAYVLKQEAVRTASEDRGYPVSPDAFTVKEYDSAQERLDAAASKKFALRSPCGWAELFALELAVLNGKQEAARARFHSRRFEQTLLDAARRGALRMRTLDPVAAPIEIEPDMRDDFVTQRLGVTTTDLQEWAAKHWPELAQSRLLAEHGEADTTNRGHPDLEAKRVEGRSDASETGREVGSQQVTARPQGPPGKTPRTAIGRLVVEAAWEIEQEKGGAATDRETLARLQKWANAGTKAETLETNPSPGGVYWINGKAKRTYYRLTAIQKTLQRWRTSRDKPKS